MNLIPGKVYVLKDEHVYHWFIDRYDMLYPSSYDSTQIKKCKPLIPIKNKTNVWECLYGKQIVFLSFRREDIWVKSNFENDWIELR